MSIGHKDGKPFEDYCPTAGVIDVSKEVTRRLGKKSGKVMECNCKEWRER